MDVILIILGALGLGAIVISTYVFTVAARNYVTSDSRRYRGISVEPERLQLVARSPTDRRSGRPVAFPLTVNGILIANDRRSLSERRMAS